jgi:hypothetical protein
LRRFGGTIWPITGDELREGFVVAHVLRRIDLDMAAPAERHEAPAPYKGTARQKGRHTLAGLYVASVYSHQRPWDDERIPAGEGVSSKVANCCLVCSVRTDPCVTLFMELPQALVSSSRVVDGA